MCATCIDVESMPVMVQIRNVPDELHRTLKSRAALRGMSLSDYLLAQLRESAGMITPEEMAERLASRPPVDLPQSAADLIRCERDSR
jgi:plasmid stability protein